MTRRVPAQTGLLDAAADAITARIQLAVLVFILTVVLSWAVGKVNRRLLVRAGVPESIEGTAFERTARELGTSTVDIVSKLSAYFIVILGIIVALTIAQFTYVTAFWQNVASFLPNLFFAALVLIVGIVVGDKVGLLVNERLRGIKLPQVAVIPTVAKFSVFYIAALLALSQVGVATLALIVLLAIYGLALIVFGAVAFEDLLASGAAGMYLLLQEPYGIGDEVKIGGHRGIVQEVDVFTTHIEADGEEYVVPNSRVFSAGIVRIRD